MVLYHFFILVNVLANHKANTEVDVMSKIDGVLKYAFFGVN